MFIILSLVNLTIKYNNTLLISNYISDSEVTLRSKTGR